MEIVETWYFQIWVNFGGMAELCVFQYNFSLNVAIFSFTMRSNFTFLTFQKRKKTLKSGILKIL